MVHSWSFFLYRATIWLKQICFCNIQLIIPCNIIQHHLLIIHRWSLINIRWPYRPLVVIWLHYSTSNSGSKLIWITQHKWSLLLHRKICVSAKSVCLRVNMFYFETVSNSCWSMLFHRMQLRTVVYIMDLIRPSTLSTGKNVVFTVFIPVWSFLSVVVPNPLKITCLHIAWKCCTCLHLPYGMTGKME